MRTVFIWVCLLFLTYVANAQKFSYEIHAGSTYAQLTGKNGSTFSNTGYKFGFTAGIGLQYDLAKRWALQTELNYQDIGGGNDERQIVLPQGYARYRFQYAVIPLLIKLKIPRSNLALFVGPQYGYLLSNRLKTSAGQIDETKILGHDDFSGIGGAEYYFPLLNGDKIVISGRYQYGARDIYNFNDKLITLKNRSVALTLGYRF